MSVGSLPLSGCSNDGPRPPAAAASARQLPPRAPAPDELDPLYAREHLSLELDFGEVEAAPRLHGVAPRMFERLTLNNNRLDYSRSRSCLSYDLFASAGVPAPRCNLAHVVVNGKDLGTYSNVEPIRKPFLKRHFGNGDGSLYEGQLVDFTVSDLERFQLKAGGGTPRRGGLERLASALTAEDGELVARLGELIDLEGFRDFWAMERLTGHWDGYAGNRNNFYLYADPGSGRLHFIPWGTDAAFADAIPGDENNTGSDVSTNEPRVGLRLLWFSPNGKGLLLQLSIPPAEFAPGSRLLHGFETVGFVVVLDGANTRLVGFISDGTLELGAASAVDGALVSGRLNAKLPQTGCAGL